MGCSNLPINGLANPCKGSRGGVTKVVIANYVEDYFTVTEANQLSAKDGNIGEIFKKYYVRPESSGFEQTLTVDTPNGINYIDQNINLVFARMETASRMEVAALTLNDTMVACKTGNGNWFVFGYDAPVTCTSGTGSSGVAVGDGNKFTIGLTTRSDEWAYEASPELAEQLNAIE